MKAFYLGTIEILPTLFSIATSCFFTSLLAYSILIVEDEMETKEVIFNLRTKNNMTQEELAEKVYVTRQAVSRWETGETTPNIEALKQLSRLFDVSINTLLGSKEKLICQCCGMELEDSFMSSETDGAINQDYCQWCYSDGEFSYSNMEDLITYCSKHLSNEKYSEESVREYMSALLPTLKHWKG